MFHKTGFPAAMLLLGATLLTACAAKDSRPETLEGKLAERGLQRGESVERIQNYRIDGWNYVDRRHVIFEAGPGRRYLISLRVDCSDLRGEDGIGFSSTGNSVSKFEKVVVRTAIGPRDCQIDEIHELEEAEE